MKFSQVPKNRQHRCLPYVNDVLLVFLFCLDPDVTPVDSNIGQPVAKSAYDFLLVYVTLVT